MNSRGVIGAIGALFALAVLGLAACTHKTTMEQGTRIERVDREFDLAAHVTRVAIDNPWGEINIRGRDEREVGVHAVVQRFPPLFPAASFRAHLDGTTLHIDVGLGERNAANAKPGRIDVAVYVPSSMTLDLTTKDGRISAKKRLGAITARTDGGAIEASSFDRLDLHSRSGQIRAIAISKRWHGQSEVATDSGRIILLVPTFGDIALQAGTRGRLTTNFGLSVHALGDGRHEAHARYGAGTSALIARSATGEVVLEQLVLLGDHSPDLEDDD